ncbi:MAG: ABC transporter permease [Chloroflexota bacterium]
MNFKQIVSLMRQDLANSMRDNLVLYMFVAPILLALGARVFLPALEDTRLTFAVESAVDASVIAELQELGEVELLESREAVIERVERNDDVPGIVLQEDAPERFAVYLEGNEPEGEELVTIIMSSVLQDGQVASFVHEELRASRSLIGEYGAVVLVMLAVMIGALVMGFLVVDDKETNAIQALAVSPLTMTHYLLARALFAVTFSTIIALISSLILAGSAVNYGELLVGFLVACSVGLIIGYVVGGFTNNQLEAIGLIKIVMFAYLTIPILTIFVPDNWQWAFYLLPNYWMFKIFENLFVEQSGSVGFWQACALTLGTSAAYLLALAPLLRRRMQLRFA